MATSEIPSSRSESGPPKTPETQLEVLRRVIPEFIAGSLKGNTVDLLGLPVDVINQLLGVVGLKSEKPYGGADSIRESLGIKKTSEDTAAEIGGSFVSPAGLSKAMIVGAARILKKEGFAPEAISKVIQTAKDAESLQMAGVKASVFDTTGVFVGKEGKARAALSDEKATIYPGALKPKSAGENVTFIDQQKVTNLDDLLRHDELFSLYPELKSYKVRADNRLKVDNAIMEADSKVITLGPASSVDQLRNTVLHEVQHGVQDIEKLLPGASPADFVRYRVSPQAITKIQNARDTSGVDSATQAAAQRYADKINSDYRRAHGSYQRTPGEVEARFTEQSSTLPAKELNSKIYNLISDDTPYSLWAR